MNQWHIAGRLGRDAELRRTQAGDPVCSFSVAVDERRGQEKTTLWVDCSIWGKRAETLERYLTKGTTVAIAGTASVRLHNDKAYMQCRVSELTLLGGGTDRSGSAPAARQEPAPADDLDDEVPF